MSRRPNYYNQKTSLKSRLATINKTYVEDWEQPLHFAVHWYALSFWKLLHKNSISFNGKNIPTFLESLYLLLSMKCVRQESKT